MLFCLSDIETIVPVPTVFSWQTHIHSTIPSITLTVKSQFPPQKLLMTPPLFQCGTLYIPVEQHLPHSSQFFVYIAIFSTGLRGSQVEWKNHSFQTKQNISDIIYLMQNLSKLPNLTEHYFLICEGQIICISHRSLHGSDNNDKMLNTQQHVLTSVASSDHDRHTIIFLFLSLFFFWK